MSAWLSTLTRVDPSSRLSVSLALLGGVVVTRIGLGVARTTLDALIGLFRLRRRKLRVRKGAWALVTGGTDGLGRRLVVRLSEAGVSSFVTARDRSKFEALRKDLGDDSAPLRFSRLDLCDYPSLSEQKGIFNEMFEQVKIDLLVLNAGMFFQKRFRDCSFAELDQIFNINFANNVALVSSHLAQTEDPLDIIFISSFLGLVPNKDLAIHPILKFSFAEFLKLVRRRLAKAGRASRVSTVYPRGFISSVYKNNGESSSGIFGVVSADSVASAVLERSFGRPESSGHLLHELLNLMAAWPPFFRLYARWELARITKKYF